MIKVLLLHTGHSSYVEQLSKELKKYYPELQFSLLTTEGASSK